MALRTVFCKHYQGMSEHDHCKAGVAYEIFKGVPHVKMPCFAKRLEPARPGCELVELPTEAEMVATDERLAQRFARTIAAREAIVTHLGGPWKRGVAAASGAIDCPVCGGSKTLRFSRAGINGHIHAGCATDSCVSWME